jgi:uncharacterized oxidoreductase
MDCMNMTGNTIFITGGGSGIGRGLAEGFHRLGNKIIIAGRRQSVLQAAAAANPGMEYAVLDTTDANAIRLMAKDVTLRFPKLNVVINNAGVQSMHDFGSGQPFDDAAAAQEIETNIYGVLRTTAAFLPILRMHGATIINVSSGLAFVPLAKYPVYCATKAFIHSFSMSLRHQLRKTSVRVIELAPPWVATELDAKHIEPVPNQGMKPMPLADFIAAAMEELASEKQELPVAGAKFLYSGGISERAEATFAQINS